MRQNGQLTAGKRGCPRRMPWADALTGHLRVREGAAGEPGGPDGFFPDRDRGPWAAQGLQSGRAWSLVVEIFQDGRWVPLGQAAVDADGQIIFCILPGYRGLGRSAAAIRSVLQHMRQYPLAVLSARIGDAEPAAAKAFERAGFVLAGQSISAGRIERLYEFVIRDECTAFNVWI